MSRILKVSQGDYRVQVPSGNDIWLDTGTSAGSVIITGNLDVRGTTETVDSVNTSINDNILTLNKGQLSAGISLGYAGIEIDRGTLTGQKLSAKLVYNESLNRFIIQTAIDSTNTLSNLQLDVAKLNKISDNGTGIVLDLTTQYTTITIDSAGIAYHDRILQDNSIITNKILTSYVSANGGYATVNQLTQSLNSVEKSKVIATDTAIEFYIDSILIGEITDAGLLINNIQSITGNLSLHSKLESDQDVLFTGKVNFDTALNDQSITTTGTGVIIISSGATGSIDNIAIGTTTPAAGKFTTVEVTTDIIVPVGSTNARPATTSLVTPPGNLRYNTDLRSFEGWNGTVWGTVGGGLQSSPGIVIANFQPLANNLIRADSTDGTFTITLPDSPNDGDVVGIIDIANKFATNPVIVAPGAVGTIEGTTSVILDLDGTFVSFVYVTELTDWKLEQTPTGPSSGSAGLTITNSRVLSRATTSDATPTALTFDGAAPTATNQLILVNDSTYTFSILVTARRTDVDNESAGYKFEGVIDRNNVAATTNFVGVPVKVVLGKDSATWDCDITADIVNGGLRITVTGEANKTIKWVAVCNTAEVTG